MQFSISKYETNVMKAISIILIMFHNFFHYLSPSSGENEMEFNVEITHSFFRLLKEYPLEFINLTFSYLGFYGVFLFIFLSGYGLTLAFKKAEMPSYIFVKNHILKIYKLFLIGAVCIIIFQFFYYGSVSFDFFKKVLVSLTLTNNFNPDNLFNITGPWWFFSLIIQLYLCFYFIYFLVSKNKKNGIFIILASYIVIYFLMFFFKIHPRLIFGNFIGHLPEFTLGIFLAMYPKIDFIKSIILLSLIIFVASWFFVFIFPLSFISSAILLISLSKLYIKASNELVKTNKVMLFIGELSPLLFCLHGFTRKLFLPDIFSKIVLSPMDKIGLACLWFVFCILMAYLVKKTIEKTKHRIELEIKNLTW